MISIDDVHQAARRILPYIHHTPVHTSTTINAMVGASIYFKCENLQKVGAFKARGATNAVFQISNEQGKRGVATHSSGNHAQALAYAAGLRSFRCTVVMPDTSPQIKVDAVRGYGADVIFCENTLAAREEALENFTNRTGAHVVHPYNDDRIIAGQATAALELIAQTPRLDVVMAPVGGGGLISGTSVSARTLLPQSDIVGAEPALAGDAAISLETGVLQAPFPPLTIADGLRTALCERTFEYLKHNGVRVLTCSEESIRKAQRIIFERMKLVVEPSGAVPLAVILEHADEFRGRIIGCIITGGNVDLDRTFAVLA